MVLPNKVNTVLMKNYKMSSWDGYSARIIPMRTSVENGMKQIILTLRIICFDRFS